MQVPLDRFHGLLQGKEHDDREGQLAFAGKILRAHAMTSNEAAIAQLSAQRFNKINDMDRDGFDHGTLVS
ncbi:MAG: hypothetical protein Q7R45_09765 [Sulfuricaulis sp.]|nr:hypothetical protein [Sulfuricaulis sp.]